MANGLSKKVVVTGGAGFIGSHLCDRMIEAGNEVLAIDNFFTGNRGNIQHLGDNPKFEALRQDITEPMLIHADEIYNMACPASPVSYQFDPIKTVQTNVNGAINVLEMAFRDRAKVLQASTSEVYGDPEMHPQREEYWGNVNPLGIRSCYDEGKRCAESLFFSYQRERQVAIKVARIFNTYGPRMQPDDGRVVSNFIVHALTGQPITIYGDGKQTRAFCYVDDLVDGLIRLMGSRDGFAGPVNLGNPGEFTMLQLAELVVELTGTKSAVTFHPLPGDDPKQRQPDITLAGQELNWQPTTPLSEGLKLTIDYFDRLLSDQGQKNAGEAD